VTKSSIFIAAPANRALAPRIMRLAALPSIILDQAQKRYSDLIDVVATGLWPVRVGIVFTQEDGPQGRGYSGAYSGILFKSLSLWAVFSRQARRSESVLWRTRCPRSPQPRCCVTLH
jgi:hypothetical protein